MRIDVKTSSLPDGVPWIVESCLGMGDMDLFVYRPGMLTAITFRALEYIDHRPCSVCSF